MKTIKGIFLMALMVVVAVSCKKGSSGPLGGTVTPMGEVGNTFNIYPLGSLPGVGDITAEITDLEDDVSKIDFSVELTNEKLKTIANVLKTLYPTRVSYSDGSLTGSIYAKFTDEGVAEVLDEGELIYVKYNAKVGDTYSLKVGDNTIKHKVVSKSSDDDFYWSGSMRTEAMYIKVIEVEATGLNLPGLDKMVYYFNHKFGFVGADFKFTDGTSQSADIVSFSKNS